MDGTTQSSNSAQTTAQFSLKSTLTAAFSTAGDGKDKGISFSFLSQLPERCKTTTLPVTGTSLTSLTKQQGSSGNFVQPSEKFEPHAVTASPVFNAPFVSASAKTISLEKDDMSYPNKPTVFSSVNEPASSLQQQTSGAGSFSFVAALGKSSKSAPEPSCHKSTDLETSAGNTSSKPSDEENATGDDSLKSKDDKVSSAGTQKKVSKPKERGPHSSLLPSAAVSNLKSIICKGIDADINNKDVLLKHFSAFGEVEKVTCNKKSKHAIILFKDHASAEQAKRKGTEISPGSDPVPIFWLNTSSLSKKEKTVRQAHSEVEDELKAMLEAGTDHELLSRPTELKKEEKKPLKKEKIKKEKKVVKEKPSSQKVAKEKPSSQKVDSQTSSQTSQEHLMKILRQATHTAEERFSVLDARDKLIRLRQPKQSDFATASAIVGTCPDMCPEKERYSRFAKINLSVFETKDPIENTSLENLDHSLIVKEYSRSSADQEEPLPHELRSTAVLQKTMDYLLCNIMDKLEGNTYSVRDWYDFIWSRTRAIRKDITQQHLCNVECVAIVEKCARFHIHCAAALCEEDMAVFDRKINDENLTKCLQTLKHFYEDLANKNISCSNEPEFRAYDILLSLNEGDALRHVQKLREDIRNSPEIQFSVSAALAYSSNNYVKFFRLVSEASYMNACILHRYFTHVRVNAIHITLKAYCAPNRTEMYPVEDIMHMLKFESFSEVKEFCEMLGIKVDLKYVHLDRSAFAMPVAPLGYTRSLITVEKKRRDCLGAVINSGALPPNPLDSYSPHNSFDERGMLKKEAFEALDQNERNIVSDHTERDSSEPMNEDPMDIEEPTTDVPEISDSASLPKVVSSISPEPIPVPQGFRFHFPTVSSTASSMFSHGYMTSVQDTKLTEAPVLPLSAGKTGFLTPPEDSRHRLEKTVQHSTVCEDVYKKLRDDVVGDMVRQVASEIVCVESDLLTKAKQAMMKVKKQRFFSKDSCEKIFTDLLQTEIFSVVKECLLSVIREELSADVLNDIIRDQVDSIISAVANEVHQHETRKQLQILTRKAKENVALVRARKIFDLWKHAAVQKKKELDRSAGTLGRVPIIKAQYSPSDGRSLENPVTVLSVRKRFSCLLRAGVLCEVLREELAWLPLDLAPVFEKALSAGMCFPQVTSNVTFWKMLLLVYEDDPTQDLEMTTRWITAKFTKGRIKQEHHFGTNLCSFYWLTSHTGNRIAICVRRVILGKNFTETLKYLREECLLEGTCAVLLCLPVAPAYQLQLNLCILLKELLKARTFVPSIPLHCFYPMEDAHCFSGCIHMFLDILKGEGLLSEHCAAALDSCNLNAASQKVYDATEWLVRNCPHVPDTPTCYLRDYIENCISEIFSVVFEDLAHRKDQRSMYQDPWCIISFFNTIIKKKTLPLEQNYLAASWPFPELDVVAKGSGARLYHQGQKEALRKIRRIVSSVTLPAFDGDPLCLSDAWNYALLVKSKCEKDAFCFLSSVRYHLQRSKKLVNATACIPWADVLRECVNHIASAADYFSLGEELQVSCLSSDDETSDLHAEWYKIQKQSCIPTLVETSGEGVSEISPCAPGKRKREVGSSPEPSPKVTHLERTDEMLSHLKSSLKDEEDEQIAFDMLLKQECTSGESFLSAESDLSSRSLSEHDLYSSFESSQDEMNASFDDVLQKMSILKERLESECRAEQFFESRLTGLVESYADQNGQLC